jgi:hypothetical protein
MHIEFSQARMWLFCTSSILDKVLGIRLSHAAHTTQLVGILLDILEQHFKGDWRTLVKDWFGRSCEELVLYIVFYLFGLGLLKSNGLALILDSMKNVLSTNLSAPYTRHINISDRKRDGQLWIGRDYSRQIALLCSLKEEDKEMVLGSSNSTWGTLVVVAQLL